MLHVLAVAYYSLVIQNFKVLKALFVFIKSFPSIFETLSLFMTLALHNFQRSTWTPDYHETKIEPFFGVSRLEKSDLIFLITSQLNCGHHGHCQYN